MQRLISFDIAKAICIILVVIGHYVPDYSPEWYVGVHDVIYTFHMPLFMFASGFIYMATKKNVSYRDFLWKKVKRLMIPYLSVSTIVITIKLLTESHAYVENPVSAMSYLRMFYFPEAGHFLWFIWALWWMFVIVPLFKTKQARLVLLVLAIILHYSPSILPEEFCLRQFQNMAMFFMLGVACRDWENEISFVKKVPAWSVLGCFVIAESMKILQFGGGGNRDSFTLYWNCCCHGDFKLNRKNGQGDRLADNRLNIELHHLSFPYHLRRICKGCNT